ncbi:MAG TPA: TonB-dependent receptor [Sphingobacteriaceae bacterium]|nr:TonB-dependent receptor [Sphingobacteriaceae bacterium]
MSAIYVQAQETGKISGLITDHRGEPIAGATITLERTATGTVTDEEGQFTLSQIPVGKYTMEIKAIGYQSIRKNLELTATKSLHVEETLHTDNLSMSEVVVSATRYGVSRKEAPVIVNVISPKIFNATQSVAMSETLNFQPGVRVETNCQNCGFSQVRLNGLEGGYSQILINSRAVFSALNSVYGLDQIPTSMVDRIEVVRSGGSALYGSNAIAGTINVITKEPVENLWQIGTTMSLIDGQSWDKTLDFNSSIVDEDLMSGVTFYGMNRVRQAYDANGDGFTEMTKLNNTTFGAKAFYRPSEFNNITMDVSTINEFRRGGDRLDLVPHFTDITEQLDHKTFMGGLTYDHYSRDYSQKYSLYGSAQGTKRASYYGGLAGNRTAQDSLLASNAYGDTDDIAMVAGVQYTKNFANDVITAGYEFQYNNTLDQIEGYNRRIDQTTASSGLYAQYEWKPLSTVTALIGARYDMVKIEGDYRLLNLQRNSNMSASSFSPRFTLLYDITNELQFRGGYARGFRAPQAFNEDMHVSSVGGEQVFVLLSDNLRTEHANAWTGSLNYTTNFGSTQVNALLEGFYTDLFNPFTTVRTNELEGVILDEMRNGSGAYVAGSNIELSVAPSDRWSIQAGGTIQRSKHRELQTIIEADEGEDELAVDRFVRTPNNYGYLNTNWKATDALSLDLTGVYTGSMLVPHQVNRTLVNSEQFMELNFRLGYLFKIKDHFNIEANLGVQNMFNSYQRDFDSGPERDSDYVYGPARPRTVYFGLKIGHFH